MCRLGLSRVCVSKVAFKFALDPNDELHDSKLSLWIRDGHAQKIVRLCVSDNENTALAFACLRVMVQKAAASSSFLPFPLSIHLFLFFELFVGGGETLGSVVNR